MKSEHLKEEDWLLLKNGKLPLDKKIKYLDHIVECELCAEWFAECFAGDCLPVPMMLNEKIRREIQETKDFEKRKEVTPWAFRGYSVKVALAACATLVLIYSGAFTQPMERNWQVKDEGIWAPTVESVNTFTQSLKDYSQAIVQQEGYKYDKEKK